MYPPDECSRRRLLRAGAVALVGTAGCLGRSEPPVGDPAPVVDTLTADTTVDTNADDALFVEDDCEIVEETKPDDPLLVGFDSRQRLGCQGLLFDGFDDLGRWGTYDGSVASGVTASAVGGRSVRLTAADDEKRAWIYRRFEGGLDLSGWDLSLRVHPGRGTTHVNQFRLQLLAPDRHNRVDMWHPVNGTTGWHRLDFGPTEEFGTPDLTDVREIRLQTWVGDGNAGECDVGDLRVTPKLDEGGVVLTFDDISLSQYEEAFPVMQEYGYPGVAGAIPWLSEDADRIDVEGLTEMQAAGWDIVSHPQAERALPDYTADEQEALLRETKQWLVDNGFESGARFIIFPYGKASETTLNLTAKYHHLGFIGGYCPSGLITGPLTVSRVNGDDLDATNRVLQLAKRHRQIAVVMYHTIGGGGDRISVAEFEETMARIDDLGLRVLTASDLWELQPVNGGLGV